MGTSPKARCSFGGFGFWSWAWGFAESLVGMVHCEWCETVVYWDNADLIDSS
jgi:hypothetical protein